MPETPEQRAARLGLSATSPTTESPEQRASRLGLSGDGTPPESAADRATGLIESGLQGLTFGFGDELTAGARTLLPEALGGIHGYNYNAALADERQTQADFKRNHPTAGRVAELAGGILPVVATGGASALEEALPLSARLGRAAAAGAKYGAVSGVGSATGGARDRVMGGVKGAAVGAALGPLVEGGMGAAGSLGRTLGLPEATAWGAGTASRVLPAGSAARQSLETLSRSIGRSGEAGSAISNRLSSEGTTPRGLSAALAQRGLLSGDKPEILADLSPEVASLTKAVTKEPGAGRAAINSVLASRNAGARARLTSDVSGGALQSGDPAIGSLPGGTPSRVNDAIENMVRDREASAGEHFGAAYGAGASGVDDPAINQVLNRPTFKLAYAKAKRMAADEGVSLPTKTVEVIPPPTGDAAMMDPAQWAQVARANGLVTTKEVPIPDVRTIHYVDRAIRRLADDGIAGKGPIVDPQHALALQGSLGQIRDRMATLVPEFGDALSDYSQRSRAIDALTTGRDILNYAGGVKVPGMALSRNDPIALKAARKGIDGLEAAVANMNPQELALFRQGAQSSVIRAINKVPATATGSTLPVLRRVFADTPEGSRWQSLLFNSPEESRAFQDAIARERTMAATSGRMGGSDTAENLSERETLNPNSGLLAAFVHPVSALRAGFAANQASARRGVYEALGNRLSVSGQKPLTRLLSELEAEDQMRNGMQRGLSAVRNSFVGSATR